MSNIYNLQQYSGKSLGVTQTQTDKNDSAYDRCALKTADLHPDGEQRAMTRLEQDTLIKWLGKEIHLAHPPRFLTERHDANRQMIKEEWRMQREEKKLDLVNKSAFKQKPPGKSFSSSLHTAWRSLARQILQRKVLGFGLFFENEDNPH
ncbi:hypothetical protein P43SY_008548 [Pythium insidiosum]|uniref:Uncharacterized protein n=1 Tax=Pythium insidiosum TaxID=114742 RepID=A0AAD5Q8X1_PYTIN|nr:hypothetical protein P43SY_008548 [Pythium insidiosum]